MLKAFQWLPSIPGGKPHLSPEASCSDLLPFSPQPKALVSSLKELCLLLPQGLLQLPLLCTKLSPKGSSLKLPFPYLDSLVRTSDMEQRMPYLC